jgi:hypothetical protein
MNTLHLSGAERRLFDSLSDSLKEGWEVTEETQAFVDNEHRRRIRFEMLRLHHPASQKFLKSLMTAPSVKEIQDILENADMSDVPGSDLAELLFAIGPDGITWLIHQALKSVQNDEDVAYAAQLSEARHEMLASLSNFAS